MIESAKRLFFFCLFAAAWVNIFTASPAFARSDRVIDDKDIVVLPGNVHPLARAQFERGKTRPSLPMERMVLTLGLSPAKQAELDRFLDEVHNLASSNFHHWLTPQEFGLRFGPSLDDLEALSGWLISHGFVVDEIAEGRTWINFTGSVADVERVFHTEIHEYSIDGKLRHANSSDPAIPRAFTDLVKGIVSLNNFPRAVMHDALGLVERSVISPAYTAGSVHYLSPADFGTIYRINDVYQTGIDGAGQTVAIVGRTHPPASNWTAFRSLMALPANPPQVIVNGPDPGDLGADEDYEADLDVEWSGAVAKNAGIIFVVSKSTGATDGVDLSAQYIVNNNLSPVMSTSFGTCEAAMTNAEKNFYNSLWQQAAAQGITSFVSSGDSGAAGCNPGGDVVGTVQAVNGLGSTPYNVAIGGTQFNEGSGSCWNATNGAGYSSAISYIPESVWNESGAVAGGSGLWATGGGASSRYAKPSWQAAPGVPADGKRDVPDVALSAAGHDAYLVVSQQGGLYAIRGTSASSPSFAGIMALVVQKTGQRQGNANVRLYQLANAQYGAGGAVVFHDIASGSNSVPGVTGYAGTAGYDPATGLGSVDAYSFVSNWMPDFIFIATPETISVPLGSAGTISINTTVMGNFNSAVSLFAAGLPPGMTASFSPASIAAPGSGSSTLTISVGSSSAAGTYPLIITGVGSGITHTTSVNLDVLQVFTITSSVTNGIAGAITPSTASVVGGGNALLTITPLTGYHLSSLIDNGVDVTTSVKNGTYAIMNVTANHTLVASFAINAYTVNALVSSGSITPASSIVNYGSPVTFTITPDSGYTLGTLSDNGTNVTATATGDGTYTYAIVSVTENHSIQASFTPAVSPVPALGIWGVIANVVMLGAIVGVDRQGTRNIRNC
jgi:subtilase family serine protease